jgi:hypothetical protein
LRKPRDSPMATLNNSPDFSSFVSLSKHC